MLRAAGALGGGATAASDFKGFDLDYGCLAGIAADWSKWYGRVPRVVLREVAQRAGLPAGRVASNVGCPPADGLAGASVEPACVGAPRGHRLACA